MRRIGRLHRIGQEHEVVIYNFAAAGTVEDRILEVLQDKIRLFELVVGELDLILGRFEDASGLERRFTKAWLSASSEEAFEREIQAIELTNHVVILRRGHAGKDRLLVEPRVWASDGLLLAPTGPLSDVDLGLIPECAHVRSRRSPERSPRRSLQHRA